MSHFVGIGLVLGFLLPHSSNAFMLVNPLLCLFYQCYKQNQVYYKYNWIVLVPIVVSLLINLPQDISSKSIIGTFTILLYFFCFPMVGKVKVPDGYFYFILGFIFISQVAYAFNIVVMERFLNTYYPISETNIDYAYQIHMQNAVNANNIFSFRLGGLYHNSNQCSRYLTFLLASFIVLNNEKPIKQLLPFIVVNLYAVLLTGSRTGFVVSSLIIMAFVFIDRRINSLWRTVIVIVSITIFLVLVLSGSSTFRSFNVVQGFDNSANVKYYAFSDYIEHENTPIRFVFGYLDENRFESSAGIMNKFDADYGYLIFQFGFVGFFAILLFFASVFRRMDIRGHVFFILLLWMISSTIVTSFRAIFIFILLLSVIYNQRKMQANT